MTNADLSKMVKKYLVPSIGSEYSLKKNILYRTPVKDIILGFCFERSANDKNSFYVWAFGQPLYVLTEDFVLTFGIRLSNKKTKSERWEFSKDAFEDLANLMKTEGLIYIENISNPERFYRYFKEDKSGSIRVMEAVVYSGFFSDSPESNDDAMRLLRQIREKEDVTIPWVKEIRDNVEMLLNARKKSKDDTQSILQDWKRRSFESIGI
jgi:hypothetical protein